MSHLAYSFATGTTLVTVNDLSIGNTFTVLSTIVVDGLGNCLTADAAGGVWAAGKTINVSKTSDQSVVATVTIPADLSGTVLIGQMVVKSIAPVTLAPGEYRVWVAVTGPDHWSDHRDTGDPLPTTDTGGGLISIGPTNALYGTAGTYPDTDGGSLSPTGYSSATFRYAAPAAPGSPRFRRGPLGRLRASGGTSPPPPPPPPPPAPGTPFATVAIHNFGGSSLVNPEVRFAHPLGATDVPLGSVLSLDIGGTPIPATFARRSTGNGTSLRSVDVLAKLPVTIAAGGSATINLSAPTGSFSDTLPGSATASSIVADILANHDTIGITVESLTDSSPATVGSGTWSADSSTAFGLTGTHGGYRCVATGPAAADFECWMKVRDNTGGAEHAGLWAKFYICAFLDLSTGAVTKLSWRAWLNQCHRNVAQDRYTFTAKLKLGATAVRSWGYVGDGRLLSFAPSAAILNPASPPNGVNSEITLTGHGFVSGDLARFTTTGTLPAGLAAGTDYWIRVIDANTVGVCDNQQSAGQGGSTLTFTSQGSGTHTIHGLICLLRFQRHCLADTTGLWDWHSGKTQTLARPTYHAVHDATYARKTLMAPPLELSVTFANSTDPAPASWAPGTNGLFDTHYGDPGARPDIGGVWNEWACRAMRHREDRTGYVQTARVQALAMGCAPFHVVRDDSTFRVPAVNATTYSGLGSPLTSTYLYLAAGLRSADFPAALGSMNEYTSIEPSHWSHAVYPCYLFEGGQDLLDLMYDEASFIVMNKFPDAFASNNWNCRDITVSSRTYYQILRDSNEPRTDAWALNILANALAIAADSDPEKQYFKDVLTDTADLAAYTINTLGSAAWKAAGGWDLGELQKLGPGVAVASNMEGATKFMQQYCAMSFAYAYMRHGGSSLRTLASLHGTLQNNYWVNFPCKAFNSSYTIKTKLGPGAAFTDYSPWQDFGVWDDGCVGVSFNSDGTLNTNPTGDAAPMSPYQTGDRIWFTDSDQYGLIPADHSAPPSSVALYTWYYIRQATSNGTINGDPSDRFKIATTNSDSTILTWTGTVADVRYYLDSFNRTTGQPTTIHRHNGAVGQVVGGYLTLERCANAYLVLAGLLAQGAFDAADAFFQMETASGCGPGGFASQDSLMNSGVTSV